VHTGLTRTQEDQDNESAVSRPTGAIYAHREAYEDQPQTGRGLFEVECDAMQSELGVHRQQSASMEALEPLALAQFGKDALDDRVTPAGPLNVDVISRALSELPAGREVALPA